MAGRGGRLSGFHIEELNGQTKSGSEPGPWVTLPGWSRCELRSAEPCVGLFNNDTRD